MCRKRGYWLLLAAEQAAPRKALTQRAQRITEHFVVHVLLAGGGTRDVRGRNYPRTKRRRWPVLLAFVAGGALLGVKILRRNAKHVVTLNANTM
jgi:hypothetical protein